MFRFAVAVWLPRLSPAIPVRPDPLPVKFAAAIVLLAIRLFTLLMLKPDMFKLVVAVWFPRLSPVMPVSFEPLPINSPASTELEDTMA